MLKTLTRIHQLNGYWSRLAPLLIVFICWEAWVRLFKIPGYLIPAPSDLLTARGISFSQLKDFGTTALEAIAGFLLANVIALTVAVLFAHSRFFERAILPYAIAIKTTPIVALAPMLVVWLGSGIASKIVTSALISFFPMLVYATRGFKSVNPAAFDLFRTLNASKADIFFKLRFPSAVPYIFSALKVSSSLAVVGAIVGEFVGAQRGLGYRILYDSYHMETVSMFTAVVLSAAIGIVMYALVLLAEKRLLRWDHLQID